MPKVSKAGSSERQQVFQNQFTKTVICRFYLANACKKGAKCTFAHTIEELNEVPDLKKTALCKSFKRGRCNLSSEQCPFAHTRRELRMSPAFEEMSNNKKKSAASTGEPCDDAASVSTTAPEPFEDGSQSSESPPESPVCEEETAAVGFGTLAPPPGLALATEEPAGAAPAVQADALRGGGRAQRRLGRGPALVVPLAAGLPGPMSLRPRSVSEPGAPGAAAPAASKTEELRLQPKFVQVPSLQQALEARSPLDGLLDTSQQLLLSAKKPSGFRPAFVDVSSVPAPPGLEPPQQAALECPWPARQPQPPAAKQGANPKAAMQAAAAAWTATELRAIASQAEQRAAALAQEAAMLKMRADAAELALAVAAAAAAGDQQTLPAKACSLPEMFGCRYAR